MPEQEFNWNECLRLAAVSDIGMRRANNQDAHVEVLASDLEAWRQHGHLFMVADGMGAHAAGELASKLAVEKVPHIYLKHHERSAPEAILAAVLEANSEVYQRGEANAEFRSMGTTCSILLILPQGALVAHIGDSRVYRLRRTRLEQLTFDHSLVWEMRAAGQIAAGDQLAISKNVITRSLGPHPTVKVDLEGPAPVEDGDVFMLCSDGLTGRVEDEELGAVMAGLEPEEAARLLVDLANLRGGPDNVTIIIAKIAGPQLSTRAAGADPLVVGGEHDIARTVHPAVWTVTGICILASLVMFVLGHVVPGVLAALGAVVAICMAVVQKFGVADRSGVTLASGRRLGHGPHSRTDVALDAAFLQRLGDELLQRRDDVLDKGWSTDWSVFDDSCKQAKDLASQSRWEAALGHYARAAHILATEYSAHQPTGFSNSVFDF